MQEVVQAVVGLVICGALVWACFWLHHQKHNARVEKFPFWRLVFLAVTYGGALWVFLTMLAFGEWSGVTPKRSALGDVIEVAGGIIGIYLFMIAPVGMLVVGVVTAVQRGDSIYHRIVYLCCAGYAFFLLAVIVLAASRCPPYRGGPP